MASTARFSYQRLGKEYNLGPGEGDEGAGIVTRSRAGWLRLSRASRSGGVSRRWWWRRRPRVRVRGLMGRVLGRKARLVRGAVRKVVRRFKEGRAHLGDLFAGNYMFMQVTPSPPPPLQGRGGSGCYLHHEKSFVAAGREHGGVIPQAPSRYYLHWVA